MFIGYGLKDPDTAAANAFKHKKVEGIIYIIR
jgi:hypothetical protein